MAPAIVLPKAIIHLGCDLLNPLVCQNVIQNQCTAIVPEYVYLPSDATTPPPREKQQLDGGLCPASFLNPLFSTHQKTGKLQSITCLNSLPILG